MTADTKIQVQQALKSAQEESDVLWTKLTEAEARLKASEQQKQYDDLLARWNHATTIANGLRSMLKE